MVKNIRLDLFECCPHGRVCEAVYFEWQTFGGRVHLAYQQCHAFVYTGVIAQIIVHIGSKRTDIGKLPPIDRIFGAVTELLVPFSDFFGLLWQIVRQPINRAEFGSLLIRQKTDRVLIYIERALDTTPTGSAFRDSSSSAL